MATREEWWWSERDAGRGWDVALGGGWVRASIERRALALRPPFAAARSWSDLAWPGAAQAQNILHAQYARCAVVMGIRSRRRDMAGRRSGAGACRPSRFSSQESSRRRGPAAAMGAPPISTREDETAIDDWAARGKPAGGRARVQEFALCRAASSGLMLWESPEKLVLICGLSYRRAWLPSGTTGSGDRLLIATRDEPNACDRSGWRGAPKHVVVAPSSRRSPYVGLRRG